jgi:hypothetical protein
MHRNVLGNPQLKPDRNELLVGCAIVGNEGARVVKDLSKLISEYIQNL